MVRAAKLAGATTYCFRSHPEAGVAAYPAFGDRQRVTEAGVVAYPAFGGRLRVTEAGVVAYPAFRDRG